MQQVDVEALRVAVYQGFASEGRAPRFEEHAVLLEAAPAEVTAGLRELALARHLVLDDQDRIVMAHPFSAIPLGFAVMGKENLWRLASGWYAGRLHSGYTRREPAEASRYFREAGLEGPFWGL